MLGKAMRFGSMLWMSDAASEGATLDWDPEAGLLRLHLTAEAAPLYGEVAEARFNALARAIGADKTEVETED